MIPRAILAGPPMPDRQVKGDDPDEKGHPGPSGWGLDVGLPPHPTKKQVTKPKRGCHGPPRAVEPVVVVVVVVVVAVISEGVVCVFH
jgi:hypothetical protein